MSASMSAWARLHAMSCAHSSLASAITRGSENRPPFLAFSALPLSHSLGASLTLAFTATATATAASLSGTIHFTGLWGDGSLMNSNDDFIEECAESSSMELSTISMSAASCADSRWPVATSTICSPSTCCCLCGVNGGHAESVDGCLPGGPGGEGLRSGVAGELTLPASANAGEGGCVTVTAGVFCGGAG